MCKENVETKLYTLIDKSNKSYKSEIKGKLGGHKRLKIYGRLDCPSALRYIAKGQYVKYRVFFTDEETAIAAGYRPCAVCMPEEYKQWKKNKGK
ncbi:metal-binding protein [Clostridium sp. YIM B02515]|uniref:Metal-binding protein n=1 Tax=Clostridium rhizosphaerae TaxID=2803861 RepID=A0ABS1T885_9CLOT|nr:Ada metal-binding domain-containing protein [Clostridium rhizosphaerae]MBL4935565.1 metal-binding protein [Clostridium rhizosphaerae]